MQAPKGRYRANPNFTYRVHYSVAVPRARPESQPGLYPVSVLACERLHFSEARVLHIPLPMAPEQRRKGMNYFDSFSSPFSCCLSCIFSTRIHQHTTKNTVSFSRNIGLPAHQLMKNRGFFVFLTHAMNTLIRRVCRHVDTKCCLHVQGGPNTLKDHTGTIPTAVNEL